MESISYHWSTQQAYIQNVINRIGNECNQICNVVQSMELKNNSHMQMNNL